MAVTRNEYIPNIQLAMCKKVRPVSGGKGWEQPAPIRKRKGIINYIRGLFC